MTVSVKNGRKGDEERFSKKALNKFLAKTDREHTLMDKGNNEIPLATILEFARMGWEKASIDDEHVKNVLAIGVFMDGLTPTNIAEGMMVAELRRYGEH